MSIQIFPVSNICLYVYINLVYVSPKSRGRGVFLLTDFALILGKVFVRTCHVNSQSFSRRELFFAKFAREDDELVMDHPVVPDQLTFLDEVQVADVAVERLQFGVDPVGVLLQQSGVDELLVAQVALVEDLRLFVLQPDVPDERAFVGEVLFANVTLERGYLDRFGVLMDTPGVIEQKKTYSDRSIKLDCFITRKNHFTT